MVGKVRVVLEYELGSLASHQQLPSLGGKGSGIQYAAAQL